MTAERIYRIPQADLDRIRVTCKHEQCGKTCEMTVREARMSFNQGLCPFCQNPWAKQPTSLNNNPFVSLLTAWQLLEGVHDLVAVDFIIPEPASGTVP